MDNKLDSILEKLNITEADIADELKSAFEVAVNEAVAQEKKTLMSQADEFAARKINEAVSFEKQELEKYTIEYCNKKALTIAKKADARLKESIKAVEEAADKYIAEYFEKAFIDRYGEELQSIEENMLVQLDNYMSYAINEKIDNNLIEKTAVNETYGPIIKGIQSLFETQFVPLNNSGAKKLKEAKQANIELENTIRAQVNENIKLTEKNEALAKKALIAESAFGLNPSQKARLERYFESKDYKTTKEDIGSYVDMLVESEFRAPARPIIRESERTYRPVRKVIAESKRPARITREDVTKDVFNESVKTDPVVADTKKFDFDSLTLNSEVML